MKTVDSPKKGIPYVAFTVLLALYFALVVNIPIYKELIGIFSKLDEVKIGFIITIPISFLPRLISYSTYLAGHGLESRSLSCC